VPHFITKAGLIELQAEYDEIVNIKIPEVLQGLNQALEAGDLSENSARDALLLEQQRLLAKKQEIEEILNDYEIIEEGKITKSKIIHIGSTVKVEYVDQNKVFDVKIMGSSEADVLSEVPRISNESPLALAILGKSVGNEVTVRVKQKKMQVKILEILE
jgi:transcription elongation factor GreA